MSRVTFDDQLKFLLSCVRHSNYGRVDFVEVASECGIVSKGAALTSLTAKRYERLFRSIDTQPGPSKSALPSLIPKQKSNATIAKEAAAKRRKIEGDSFNEHDDDFDDDGYVKSETIKPEPMAGLSIKSEEDPEVQNIQPFGIFLGGSQHHNMSTYAMPQHSMPQSPGIFQYRATMRQQPPYQTQAVDGQQISQIPYASSSALWSFPNPPQQPQQMSDSPTTSQIFASTCATSPHTSIPHVSSTQAEYQTQNGQNASMDGLITSVERESSSNRIPPSTSLAVSTRVQTRPEVSTNIQAFGTPEQHRAAEREYILIAD